MNRRDHMCMMADAQGPLRTAKYFGVTRNAVNLARRRQRKALSMPAVKRTAPTVSSAMLELLCNEWIHELPIERVRDIFMHGVHAVYNMPRRDMLAARHKYQTNKKMLDGITTAKAKP